MSEGSDKKKDPLLEDTQEMERIRAPGFREQRERQPSGIVDPWNDVTPQDLSGEQPALDVTASYVDEDEDDRQPDFLGDGPYASPVDTPQEERVMRIADPRSPSAISRFALATSALSQPVIVPPRSGRAASGIRIGDAPVAIARRLPSGI